MDKWEDQYHLRQPDELEDPASSEDEPEKTKYELQDSGQDLQQDPQQWQQMQGTGWQQPRQEGYWHRLWRMWSAFFIKLGISYLVSIAAATVLLMAALLAQSGYDQAAMEALMEDEAALTALTDEVLVQMTEYTVPIEGLAALITIPILLFMFHRDRVREKLAGIREKLQTTAVQYLIVIVLAAAMCIGLNGLFMISGLSVSDESYVESMEVMYSPSLWMQLICLGILTPLCEELTYRGLLFKRMRQESSFVMAALFSTIIFALMHGYLVSMIYAFCMGFTFAWLYEKFDSVLLPVAAHMTANIVSVLATYFCWFDWLLEEPVRIGVLTVACAAAASSMYVLIRRLRDVYEDEPEQSQGTGQE